MKMGSNTCEAGLLLPKRCTCLCLCCWCCSCFSSEVSGLTSPGGWRLEACFSQVASYRRTDHGVRGLTWWLRGEALLKKCVMSDTMWWDLKVVLGTVHRWLLWYRHSLLSSCEQSSAWMRGGPADGWCKAGLCPAASCREDDCIPGHTWDLRAFP